MKILFSMLIALGLVAGVAQASTPAPAKTEAIVQWGCGYGH